MRSIRTPTSRSSLRSHFIGARSSRRTERISELGGCGELVRTVFLVKLDLIRKAAQEARELGALSSLRIAKGYQRALFLMKRDHSEQGEPTCAHGLGQRMEQ